MPRINFAVAGLACAAIFLGCKKTDLRFNGVSFSRYRVAKIEHSPCCGLSETMVFSYNKMGDPLEIKQLPGAKTGAPDYFFRYDKKHRLTELRGIYLGGEGGEIYHRYFYAGPGNNNIVLDSIYNFPVFENDVMVSYYSASASHLFYDRKSRIIKDSVVNEDGYSTTVYNFVYDAGGNLDGRNYDDKVNIHQTNKIWMFLDRDYSINNPFNAATYNQQGLPTSLSLTGENADYLKFITFMRTATIQYQRR